MAAVPVTEAEDVNGCPFTAAEINDALGERANAADCKEDDNNGCCLIA